jgi:RNA polymerase sigma-70 factor (ECF subfamily)
MGEIKRDAQFEEMFHRLQPRALHLALRVTGDRAVAEELAAEALARTFADWKRVRTLEYVDAWVLRVTTNLALNVVTRRRPELDRRSVVVGPEDAAAVHVALVAALTKLPVRQREAVVLRHLADLSEDDVARSLGVSAGTVKQHVHRGLAALRGLLRDDDGAVGVQVDEEVPGVRLVG